MGLEVTTQSRMGQETGRPWIWDLSDVVPAFLFVWLSVSQEQSTDSKIIPFKLDAKCHDVDTQI